MSIGFTLAHLNGLLQKSGEAVLNISYLSTTRIKAVEWHSTMKLPLALTGKRLLRVGWWYQIQYVTLIETLAQYFFVMVFSPLFAGIMSNLKGKVESRQGPSIFQPYHDLFKLFRKETVKPAGSGIVFLYAPYVGFGIYSLLAIMIPALIPEPVYFTASADFLGGAILFALTGFIKTAAAISSHSNFSALGVSRIMSFNFLSEGTLITVFFGVSLITSTNNPFVTIHFLIANPLANISLTHIFSTLAFFMLFLYETGKMPLENPGLMELGMVDEAVNFEYSGKLLAISRWGGYLKQCLLGSVLLNVFLLPWGLSSQYPAFLLDIPVMIGKWILLIFMVVAIETTLSKLRLFRVLDYLATAFTFSILFLIFSEVMV